MRFVPAAVVWLVSCAAPPQLVPAPSPVTVSAAPAEHFEAAPAVLRPDGVPGALKKAYELWASDRRQEALTMMREAIAVLERPAPARKSERRRMGTNATYLASDDGVWLAAGTAAGVVMIDRKTGTPIGLLDAGAAGFPGFSTFVPGTTLLAVHDSEELVVFDVPTRANVARLGAVEGTAAALDVLVYASAGAGGPATLHVWDAENRIEARSFDTKLDAVSDLEWLVPGELLVARGSGSQELFDVAAGESLGDYGGAWDTGIPAASPDGAWIARSEGEIDDTGAHGKTMLLARATRTVVATSGACSYPTSVAFSSSGSLLAVGDLRRACILRVPSLRLVARTGEVRPSEGADDDLQNTTVAFHAADSLLEVTTADGSVSLFDARGRALWSGRGQTYPGDAERVYVVDRDRALLWTVSARKIQSRKLTTDEVEERTPLPELGPTSVIEEARAMERANSALCQVGPWVFPRAACDSPPVTSR